MGVRTVLLCSVILLSAESAVVSFGILFDADHLPTMSCVSLIVAFAALAVVFDSAACVV